jgi:hypothetical protein
LPVCRRSSAVNIYCITTRRREKIGKKLTHFVSAFQRLGTAVPTQKTLANLPIKLNSLSHIDSPDSQDLIRGDHLPEKPREKRFFFKLKHESKQN